MELIQCRDCAWFKPIEDYPEAIKLHNVLQDAFGDILPPREGKVGVCKKVTFSKERPVVTHEEGFCHRADKKEDD